MPPLPSVPPWVLPIVAALAAGLAKAGPILGWWQQWRQARQLVRPQMRSLDAGTDKALAETIGLLATRVEQQEQKIGALLRANEDQEVKLRAALEENAMNRAKLQNAQEINAPPPA